MPTISENMKELRKRRKAQKPRPSVPFARELAEALDWKGGSRKIERVQTQELPFHLNRVLINQHPAAVFVGHRRMDSSTVVKKIACFCYHTSIHWGVVTNYLETIIINSHWVRNGQWFSLPPISWSELQSNSGILHALTPEGIQSGELTQIAHTFYQPDEFLVPVDDKLVDCLDIWRDEALRHAETCDGVDEKIQTLFAQLFVLRAVEDRTLAPNLPLLESVLIENESVDMDKLSKIFKSAKKLIQSELFDTPLPKEIPNFIFAGIIQDLYIPRQFPIENVKYNFAWMGADVLGRAYEKYLSSVLLTSSSVDSQLRLWDQPKREVERVTRRKASGVYYTPDFIVRYLTEKSLQAYFKGAGRQNPPRIADVSCGSGSFLTTGLDIMLRHLKSSDPKKKWGREVVKKRLVVGTDIDQRAVTLARLAVWLRLAEEPNPLPLPNLADNIVCGDSLDASTWANLPKEYDIIIGNPPFIPRHKIQKAEVLSKKFKTARGRYDYSYLFVELSLRLLRKGGFLGLVIPNRLFRNPNASNTRNMITEQADILTVVDFGSTEVFKGTSSYIGLLSVRKLIHCHSSDKVRVINVGEIPTLFPDIAIARSDSAIGQIKTATMSSFDCRQPHGGNPWVFLSPSGVAQRIYIEDCSDRLSSIANVSQGIKTGANDIFIVRMDSTETGGLCRIVNKLGDTHIVERDCLRPVTFGSEIQRYDVIVPKQFLIYPYRSNGVIGEEELKKLYPRTYEYLEEYYHYLADRSSIISSRRKWFELVRERNETWLQQRKLLIRELATEPAFALDESGGVFLVGGTAIVPQDDMLLEPLLGYLNSKVAGWYLSLIAPDFRAGFQKFEPNNIGALPIPNQITCAGQLRDNLTKQVRQLLRAKQSDDTKLQREYESRIDTILTKELHIDVDEIM